MKQRLMWSVFVFAAAAVMATAQTPTIRVSKGVADKITIGIEPFGGDASAAQQISSVLASDLVRSDWFSYVAAANAEFIVRGDASGASLNGTVYRRGVSAPVFQKTCSADSGNLRSVAHQMADEIVRQVAQKRGIAQTKIAFIANGTGQKELYVMDYDGANVKRMTNDRSLTVRPRFGPNRSTLVFTSYRGGWPDIYLVRDINAPALVCVASYPGLNTGGAISPDGRRLALVLSRDGNPELYVKDLTNGSLARLSRTRQVESSPCWSPDGSQICFVSDRAGSPQLYVTSAGGGEGRRVTFGGYRTEPDWAPWSADPAVPDICFTLRAGKQFQIGVMNSRGGNEAMLTVDGYDNEDPTWAPDGRHIVFTKAVNHRKSLYILDAFTGRAIELNPNLRVLGDCSTPAWSR
ncbi:MAG: PD40 domain-containing protein [Verrucomicrobia bacterium]|nr:PD40 domain-containing protein [Verrucomicrobiota bacterium]